MLSDNTLYYDTSKGIRTTEEQIKFLNAIDDVLKVLYTNKPLSADDIATSFGEQYGQTIQKSMTAMQIDIANVGQVKDYFTGLSEYVKKAEVLHITLAIEPDAQVVDMLGEWVQQTFPGQAVIIEINQNLSIVGGLQIDYRGRYWDYSLQNQVVKVFREKKEELFGTKT